MDVKRILGISALGATGVALYLMWKNGAFANLPSPTKPKVKNINISTSDRNLYCYSDKTSTTLTIATEIEEPIIKSKNNTIQATLSIAGNKKDIQLTGVDNMKLSFNKSGRYDIQVCSGDVCSNTVSVIVIPAYKGLKIMGMNQDVNTFDFQCDMVGKATLPDDVTAIANLIVEDSNGKVVINKELKSKGKSNASFLETVKPPKVDNYKVYLLSGGNCTPKIKSNTITFNPRPTQQPSQSTQPAPTKTSSPEPTPSPS